MQNVNYTTRRVRSLGPPLDTGGNLCHNSSVHHVSRSRTTRGVKTTWYSNVLLMQLPLGWGHRRETLVPFLLTRVGGREDVRVRQMSLLFAVSFTVAEY